MADEEVVGKAKIEIDAKLNDKSLTANLGAAQAHLDLMQKHSEGAFKSFSQLTKGTKEANTLTQYLSNSFKFTSESIKRASDWLTTFSNKQKQLNDLQKNMQVISAFSARNVPSGAKIPAPGPITHAVAGAALSEKIPQVIGSAAAAVGLLGAAVAYLPVTMALATTGVLSYAGALRFVGLSSSGAEKAAKALIRANPITGSKEGGLSNKGAALLPITVEAQVAQSRAAIKYIFTDMGHTIANFMHYPTLGLEKGFKAASTVLKFSADKFSSALNRSAGELLNNPTVFGAIKTAYLATATISTKFSASFSKLAGSISTGADWVLKNINDFTSKIHKAASTKLVSSLETVTQLGGKRASRLTGAFAEAAGLLSGGTTEHSKDDVKRLRTIAESRGALTSLPGGGTGGVGGMGGTGGMGGSAGGVRRGGSAASGAGGVEGTTEKHEAGRGGMGLGTAAAALTAAGTAVAGPIIAMAKAFATAGDEIDRLSKKTGIGVETLSGLAYTAKMADVPMEAMAHGIKNMQQNIVAAATGNEKAQESIAALGLDMNKLKNMTPDKQLGAFADKIANLSDPALRTAASMAIFGKKGQELIPMLLGGSAAIEKTRKDAELLGVTMSKSTIEAAARLDDQVKRLETSFTGISNAIGNAVAPVLADIANYLMAAVVTVKDFIIKNKSLVVTALAVGAALASMGAIILAGIGFVTALGVAFSAVSSIIAALPFMAVVAGITAVIGGFALLADTLLGVFGQANLGLAEMLGKFRVGGASINQWMTAAWLGMMKGWNRAKEGVLIGYEYLVAGAKTMSQAIVGVFGNIGATIARGFYTVINEVIFAFTYLADKVLTGGYALHLIDDDELYKGNQLIEDLKKGGEAWTNKKKAEADDVHSGSDTTDYMAKADENTAKIKSEADKQAKILEDSMIAVFTKSEAESPISTAIEGIGDKVRGALAKFQETLAKVKAGEGAGEALKTGNAGYDAVTAPSKEKVFGTFSGAALAGYGPSKVERLQREANGLLKTIALNTAKNNTGVFAPAQP